MSKLIVEMYLHGHWNRVGAQTPQSPEGSMSSNADGRRDVIAFACHGDYSIVRRSRGGIDREYGVVRGITAIDGFEQLARLTVDSKPYELLIQTDRMQRGVPVRFRHLP